MLTYKVFWYALLKCCTSAVDLFQGRLNDHDLPIDPFQMWSPRVLEIFWRQHVIDSYVITSFEELFR